MISDRVKIVYIVPIAWFAGYVAWMWLSHWAGYVIVGLLCMYCGFIAQTVEDANGLLDRMINFSREDGKLIEEMTSELRQYHEIPKDN